MTFACWHLLSSVSFYSYFFVLHDSFLLQVGKEQQLVWQLLSKLQAKETIKVVSVFYVPKSPGHVYFEARTLDAIRILCEGMVSLYYRSYHIFVPLTEQVVLLQVV